MKAWFYLLAILLLAVGVVRAKRVDDAERSSDTPFAAPSGPYAVGTHEYFWIDQSRHDPFMKDPTVRRRLIARVWYPAKAVPGAHPSAYILDVDEFGEKSDYRKFVSIRTNAVTDAPLADSKAPFPVLLYQPGGGTQRFVATFETEQLASHGYVVIAADHPGFSDTVQFPDGFHYKPDQHLVPKPKGNFRQDVSDNWDWLNNEVFPTWIADGSYTLDKLEEFNKTPGQVFYHRLDLSRIGAFGWSFGGAAAVEMSIEDPRVKAVIDQDGQLFGRARKEGTSRPLMLMHHGNKDTVDKPEQQTVLNEFVALTKSWDESLLQHSTNDSYTVTIAKTQHGNFSDFVLALPPAAGELDPRRAHAIIIAYAEAFFDRYLGGKDSDLLKAPSPMYPEVTFEKNNAKKVD